MAREPRLRMLFALGAIVVLAVGCGPAASSSLPAASAAVASVAAPSSASSAGSAGSISPVAIAGFADATCEANAQFGLAWGNPDANIKSAAWTSFEAAVQRRDTAALDSSATEILGHIAAARSALARGATWAPGAPANAELDAVLVALQTQVTSVRDAGADPAVAKAAAATMDTVWPRWLNYLRLVLSVGKDYPGALRNLPCESPSLAP